MIWTCLNRSEPGWANQARDFVLTEDAGESVVLSRVRKEITELRALQRADIEEPQSGDVVDDAPDRQLSPLEQVGLVSA